LWKLTTIADSYTADLSPTAATLASFSLWSLYGFFAGLFAMGLWIVAHEAGAFLFWQLVAFRRLTFFWQGMA
jgi:omega-6 fatty acid desaturase (delta-12 desaturase)